MDDQAIIDLYWARDQNAISEIKMHYGRYCHTIAMNILADHEDAAECINDTWLKAWQAIPPDRLLSISGLASQARWLISSSGKAAA